MDKAELVPETKIGNLKFDPTNTQQGVFMLPGDHVCVCVCVCCEGDHNSVDCDKVTSVSDRKKDFK